MAENSTFHNLSPLYFSSQFVALTSTYLDYDESILKSSGFIFFIFRERIYKCNVVRCAAQEKLIVRLGY